MDEKIIGIVSKNMGHQTRIYLSQKQASYQQKEEYGINIPEKSIPSIYLFECREHQHIKVSSVIHEYAVALYQKINGIYLPENLVWYSMWSPTRVQKCEWVAVP